jgi:hypothetical protein
MRLQRFFNATHVPGVRQWRAGRSQPFTVNGVMSDSTDSNIVQTPDGPMTWAEWKKKNPVQLPSRRTKGKDLPNKIKRSTDG